MPFLGTKANQLPPLAGTIPDDRIVIVPDPNNGELFRSTFGQMKSDIITAFGGISFLDPIVEVDTVADLPNPGAIKTLYVITTGADANTQWRWSGSMYIEFPHGSDTSSEASIRGNADIVLQGNINAETTARQNADIALQTNITAEATARANADTTLQGNISAEANTRNNNDITLQANINAANASIANKVDKIPGMGLSSNDYTTGEKTKLAGLESSKYKGLYTNKAALDAANVGGEGNYADVDAGTGADVARWIWDVSDTKWVLQEGTSTAETAASIKTKYESNPDTNAYTDAEKTKLSGLNNYDDTALAASIANKVDKITGKGLSTEDYTTIEKTKLAGIEAGAQVNTIDDIFPGANIIIDKTDPKNPVINALSGGSSGKYLISGGAVWSGTGLVYDVSALSYFFNGNKTAAATSKTLAASDPTDNRLDAIVVDETGAVTVITGTASASPITPAIPLDQLLIQYILVEAASTVPTVTQENIYLDNAEWTGVNYTTSGTMVGTTNFNATDSPKQGAKCIDNSLDGRTGIRFYKGSSIDLSTFTTLSIWVRFSATVASIEKLYCRFENTSFAPIGNQVNLFSYGLQKNITGTWQLAVVPTSLFGALTTVQGLRMILTGGTNGVLIEWDVDFVTLTNGSTPVISTPTIAFYKDSVKVADQKGLDIVQGTGMSITAVEDAVKGTVKYTLNSTATGGATINDTTPSGSTVYSSNKTETLLTNKVDKNTAVTADTKTKITYDAKGLVTNGTDATQDDIGDGSTYKQYSATEKTKLGGIAAGAQVNDANTTLQGNTFNGASQLVKTDSSGKLPAIDGSQLTNLPGGAVKASAAELNTGTDDAKFATSLGLENSKYLNQSGAKISATASGTDTYTATIAPAITAYSASQRFFITFTNANTGAATLNLNGLGAKSLVKNGSAALSAADISAGAVLVVAYDGTNLQIVGKIGGAGGASDNYATAAGTNTYTATIAGIAAYTEGMSIRLKFTNGNTGASTININSLGAINIYKGASTALISGVITAGQIFEMYYDGTNFQLGSVQVVPTTANKVISTNSGGALQAIYDAIDINSSTTEATLLAASWSTNVASVTGVAGTEVHGTDYLFKCTGTNTWRRIPWSLAVLDLYLSPIDDIAGIKTAAQMNTAYPAVIQGQRVRGHTGVYEYFGVFGWGYYPFTII